MSDFDYLRTKLLEQLELLIDAAEGYDRGRKVQALHIATILRTLFSPSKGGKGLIFRILSLAPRQIFLNSTCPRFDRPPRMLIVLLNYVARGERAEVIPQLDGSTIPDGDYLMAGQIALFDGSLPNGSSEINATYQLAPRKWLNESIFILSPNHQISRQFLFETATNQDGGAHVDAELHPLYERLKSLGGTNIAFQILPNTPPLQFSDVPYPALRQMAFEIITSSAVRALAT